MGLPESCESLIGALGELGSAVVRQGDGSLLRTSTLDTANLEAFRLRRDIETPPLQA